MNIGIIDDGALVFARQDGATVANIISGKGTVSQNGGGTLVLNAANTFTGAVNVVQGTLQAGNNSALGTTNGGTTVSSGATLEIIANTINLGAERITISGSGVGGAGALVNNSGSLTFVAQNLTRLTLAASATVGGSGRTDLRANPTSDPTLASLSTGGQPRKLTKVGSGTFRSSAARWIRSWVTWKSSKASSVWRQRRPGSATSPTIFLCGREERCRCSPARIN